MKTTICKNCTHYSAFYRQRTAGYEKLTYGLCSKQGKQHKKYDTCEDFKTDMLKEKRRENILYFTLESTAKSINDMINILKEKERAEIE